MSILFTIINPFLPHGVWQIVKVLVTQSCPTLYDPVDCSPSGSSVHGDSPGKEYWSVLPCLPPEDLCNPGIKPRSPTFQVDSLLLSYREAHVAYF